MNETFQKISESIDFIKARSFGDLKMIIDASHPEGEERHRQAVIEMEAKYNSVMNDWLTVKELKIKKWELGQIKNPRNNLEIQKIDLRLSQLETSLKTSLREIANFIKLIENEYKN